MQPIRERKVYSQNGEDGIIESIFREIGTTNKFYIEFGVEDGTECNTRLLRERGWRGVQLDGGFENKELGLYREFITAENILALFHKYEVPRSPDLVSVDIDYNDFYVLHKILTRFSPRLVIAEFNKTLSGDKVVVYDPEYMWDRSTYSGQSLLALKRLMARHKYKLVHVDAACVNAFFVGLEQKFPAIKLHACEAKVSHVFKADYLQRGFVSSAAALKLRKIKIDLRGHEAAIARLRHAYVANDYATADKERDAIIQQFFQRRRVTVQADTLVKNKLAKNTLLRG